MNMRYKHTNLTERIEEYERSYCEVNAPEESSTNLKTLTSAAAGLGLLLACPHAEAAIQYLGPQNIPLNSTNSYALLDFDLDGSVDCVISGSSFASASTSHGIAIIFGNTGISFWDGTQSSVPLPMPLRLSCDYAIGSSMHQGNPPGWVPAITASTPFPGLLAVSKSGYEYGFFVGARGCLAVRFDLGGGNYNYGWIDFEGDSQNAAYGIIHGWAYEEVLNAPIFAGDTGEGTCSCQVPTLNEWGTIFLIALLAAGGMIYARKEGESV